MIFVLYNHFLMHITCNWCSGEDIIGSSINMDQKRVYWLRNKIQGIFIKGTIISMRYQLLCRAREENMNINLAIVAANNHYTGFGPGTANTFKKMLDLSEVT
jgi:hypothetical protein